MDREIYWRIRKKIFGIVFWIKKQIYGIGKKYDKANFIMPLYLMVLKTIVFQLFKGILIVGTASVLDIALLSVSKADPLDAEMYKEFVLGGMGIAGVILGLYCANISSIFSAKYANVPQSLSGDFQRDIITNSCIQQIIGYIVICVLILVLCICGVDNYWFSLIILCFLTIRLIVTFSVAGSRTYILSDTFRIADIRYTSIDNLIKRISKRNVISNDESFQYHLQKVCAADISALMDIATYNLDIPKNQNSSMQKFMSDNLKMIGMYWKIKQSIPYDSRWYADKAEYQQWHYAKDHEIETATRTGTSLIASSVRDMWWFENEILKVNNLCLDKLLKDDDYTLLIKYLLDIAKLSKQAYKGDAEGYWTEQLITIQKKILVFIERVTVSGDKKAEDCIAQIVDITCCAFLNTLAGLYSFVTSLDIEHAFRRAVLVKAYEKCEFGDYPYLNNADCKRMYGQIDAEHKIEKRKITPNWFIEQTVAYQIYKRLGVCVRAIERILESVLHMGKSLQEAKKEYYGAVALSHCIEAMSKCEHTQKGLEGVLALLEKKHFETSIVWEKISTDHLQRIQSQLSTEAPGMLAKCCGVFAVRHWEDRYDSPDFLGFCYNHLCEHLLRAIELNDYSKFEAIYGNFFAVVLLYHEYVRTNLIKRKEKHIQNVLYHIATAPFVEYGMISGLAILWGEFIGDSCWSDLVDSTLKQFIDEAPDERKELLKNITNYVMARRRGVIGISNRDVLQTGWEMRIARTISSSELFGFEYREYGQKFLKTDSKLLFAFAGYLSLDHLDFNNSEDIFFIKCVNPYLDKEHRYKSQMGWEEKWYEKKNP